MMHLIVIVTMSNKVNFPKYFDVHIAEIAQKSKVLLQDIRESSVIAHIGYRKDNSIKPRKVITTSNQYSSSYFPPNSNNVTLIDI